MNITRAKIQRTDNSAYALVDGEKLVIMNINDLNPAAEDAIVTYDLEQGSAFVESRGGIHAVEETPHKKERYRIKKTGDVFIDDYIELLQQIRADHGNVPVTFDYDGDSICYYSARVKPEGGDISVLFE